MSDKELQPEDFRFDQGLTEAALDLLHAELKKSTTPQGLLKRAPAERAALLLALLETLSDINAGKLRHIRGTYRIPYGIRDKPSWFHSEFLELARGLLGRKLEFTQDQIMRLVQLAGLNNRGNHLFPVLLVLKAVGQYAQQNPLPQAAEPVLDKLAKQLENSYDANDRRAARNLTALLGATEPPVEAGERWSDRMLADIEAMPAARRKTWSALLHHAAAAGRTKPSKKWRAEAQPLLQAMGQMDFCAAAPAWFALLGSRQPSNRNSDVLRGLVCICALLDDAERIAPVLGDLADACFKRATGGGVVCGKAARAGVQALAELPGIVALAQLARLRRQIKADWVRDEIENAFQSAAARAGYDAEDTDSLEELIVPDFGLTEVGCLQRELGDYQAELRIDRAPELRWIKAGGKAQKTVPATVKRDHAEALKTLRQTAREIQKMLPAQRDRIERMLLHERVLSYVDWHKFYLDHPLVGILTRRLIWVFETNDCSLPGCWHEGQLVGSNGNPLQGLENSRVHLWHPLESAVETVVAWRLWLEQNAVVQPFKQAHREIYLLTDAERRTRTYSNRFAAHILKQHQFNALRQQRGWDYQYIGHWDSGDSVPQLRLPLHQLRVEFWVDGTAEGEASDAGVLLYIATDQVRFYRLSEHEPLALEEVPARVFSEVMRDVDLFVGVCSVGNDPTWSDQQGAPAHRDYWTSYSFGELSATAQTRRDVLERLLPRLKIAERCTVENRWLRVRGDLRTYKIHLGSGNILMEPNDQYLCIVTERSSRADRVMLPFEGDNMLAVILSKAFLLAADSAIKDRSIVNQIRY